MSGSDSIIALMSIATQCNVPAILIGEPGQGKTAVFESIADKLGLEFQSITAALFGPEDAGIPVPGEGHRVRRLYDDWAISAGERPTLVLIDELNRSASLAGFNALLRLLQERKLNGYSFHPETRFVATANPETTDSGCRPIPAALANRIAWFTGDIPVSRWYDWLMTGQGGESDVLILPKGWQSFIPQARGMVAAFTMAQPHLLSQIPTGEATGPFPTRRSWTNAATMLAAAMAMKDIQAGYSLVSSVVGSGVGAAFIEYISKANLPDPSMVLDAGASYQWPARYDIKYAIATGIISETTRRGTVDACDKLRIHAEALASDQKDIGALLVQALFKGGGLRPIWMGKMNPQSIASKYLEIVKTAGLLNN